MNGPLPNYGIAIALTGVNGSFAFDSKQSTSANTSAHSNTTVPIIRARATRPANITGSSEERRAYRIPVGSANVFLGMNAGYNNTSGGNNVFLGPAAEFNADSAANNNVCISHQGQSGENGIIRTGDPSNQTSAHIAGIIRSSTTRDALKTTFVAGLDFGLNTQSQSSFSPLVASDLSTAVLTSP